MRIEIKSDIFESDIPFRDIAAFYYPLVKNSRYEVFIDYIFLEDNIVFNNFPKEEIDFIKQSYIQFIEASARPDFFVSNQCGDFNIEEADCFFNQPVYLILENSLYDDYFIDALISNFKKASKKIKNHRQNNWLKPDNAGGANNIPNLIRTRVKAYQLLPKTNKYFYLRAIVIMDSDKEYQDMPYKQDKQNIINFCNKNNIPIVILEKREIENYIPDEVIEYIAFEDSDQYLNTYLKLNPTQKDYFDLEHGFKNKNINSLSQEIQELYSNVDEVDYKILRIGITNERFNVGKFKSQFPRLFQNEKVTQESLIKRTKHQENKTELQEILSRINEML